VGRLATYRTTRGVRVPVTLLGRSDYPIPGRAHVRVNADRGAYRKGELVICGALHVTARDVGPHLHGADCELCFGGLGRGMREVRSETTK
jgi:hypothetical protein